MTDKAFTLAGFIANLIAIIILSKIGGTGADLAIMTGLVATLGMLAPGLVPPRQGKEPQPVTVANRADEPVPVDPHP